MMWPLVCRSVLVSALLVANAARASLPPLPDAMPYEDGGAGYGDPPLPERMSGATDNPFLADGHGDGDSEAMADGAYDDNPAPALAGEEPDDRELTRRVSRPARNSATRNAGNDRIDVARSASNADALLEGPPTPLPPAQRMGSAASGAAAAMAGDNRPITLNFQHAEVAAVLNAFAHFTGLNIVASERVRGYVSLHLDKVPWRDAFDTLLDVGNLAMERRGSVIWVAPVAELAAREKQRYETHARAADLEPLASRTFELYYAKAEDVRRLLTASGAQRVLSKRGSASADPRTNLLFVTDLAARLAQIAQLLDVIDRPTRQVMIEARIVEGEEGFSRNLGARLKLAATRDGAPTGVVSGKDDTILDLSARPIAGFDAATAGLTLFVAQATRLLNIELSALEAEGHGKTVSSPRVVTADRIKAIVEQGQELPYQAKVGQGVSGVQFRRASLKLEVEPQVTPTGRVVLDLDVAKDSVGEETAAGPAINTKHVRTRVEVEDGGTVSIGGIYANDDRDDVTEVPLLGKIPVLGGLFRHRAHRRQRSELVIFITPRVVASELTDG